MSKISITDLIVLCDAASGSLSLLDRASCPLFNYTREARQQARDRVFALLEQLSLDVADVVALPQDAPLG